MDTQEELNSASSALAGRLLHKVSCARQNESSAFSALASRLFTEAEKTELSALLASLKERLCSDDEAADFERCCVYINDVVSKGIAHRDLFGLSTLLLALQTAHIAVEEIGLKRESTLAILLYALSLSGALTEEDVSSYGQQVSTIVSGLKKVHDLHTITPVIKT